MSQIKHKTAYFAAANGYGGFRSYFDKIFNPSRHTRIFVLKGGPGTGKSTLMKKLLSEFDSGEYECEAVFCSSDPSSLDGAIIRNGERTVSVIDGTAPHETDARIPGAVDEIVNLGIGWDEERLVSERETIERINRKKSSHYKNAYEYLSLAGRVNEKSNAIIEKAYKGRDTKQINDILFDIPFRDEDLLQKTELLSSFSKDGYKTLDTSERFKKGISVRGVFGSEFIFMKKLLSEIKRRNADHIRFPSPYSDSDTEAIYLYSSDTLITTVAAYHDFIDTAAFVSEEAVLENKEKLNYYAKLRSELCDRAKLELSLASKEHFELEKIYSPSMDYTVIDALTNHLTEKIKEYIL